MIFLTDRIEKGMYNTFNLYGLNASKVLLVTHFPYRLIGYLFIRISCEEGDNIIVSLVDSTNPKPIILHEYNDTHGELVILKHYVEIEIANECSVEFICNTNKERISHSYEIKIGDAPCKKITGCITESGIVQQTIKDVIKNIIESATKELLIHDTYFNMDDHLDLFNKVNKGVNVRIITGPRYYNNIDYGKNIELKTSLKGHDRFICLDNDQVFIFGYSIKELIGTPRRLSFYSRIFNKDDIEEIHRTFHRIWNNP